MFFLNLSIFFASLVSLFSTARSHDWMTNPTPYNRVFRARDCKGRQCTDACPPKWKGMNNSRDDPAVTWKRGETVRVTWAKNNHHGGMIRIALVPVDKIWDRVWHEKMTLIHGCWDSGEYKCNNEEDCGTDMDKRAFARNVTIPSTFPNGDYVLGFVWYGGLYYNSRRGFFPDFYSCSHVRIFGGTTLGGQYKAFFEPGVGPKVRRGKCLTSSDRIGDCEISGCPKRKSFRAVPRIFREGGPDPITPAIIARGFDREPLMQSSGNGTFSGSIAPKYKSHNRKKIRYEPEEHYGKEDSNGNRTKDSGVCRNNICCASSCRYCGGKGCQLREGGGSNCCMSRIVESKRRCSHAVGAPCIRS